MTRERDACIEMLRARSDRLSPGIDAVSTTTKKPQPDACVRHERETGELDRSGHECSDSVQHAAARFR